MKERNVNFDRYGAFTRKQGKTESLEQYHCGLTELVVKGNFKCGNCNDGRLETEIIRDLFIANMSNDEVQKDLLAETKTPEQALDYAIRREKGRENQILIRKQGSASNMPTTTVKSEPLVSRQKGTTLITTSTHRGEDDSVNNRNNVGTLSDSKLTKINNASNAVTHLGQDTCNNVLRRIKYATNAQREDTTHAYANHLRSMIYKRNKWQNKYPMIQT